MVVEPVTEAVRRKHLKCSPFRSAYLIGQVGRSGENSPPESDFRQPPPWAGQQARAENPRKPPTQRGSRCGGGRDAHWNWRRGWDSNPRSAFTDFGFRDRRDRPLCHLSARWERRYRRRAARWQPAETTLTHPALRRYTPTPPAGPAAAGGCVWPPRRQRDRVPLPPGPARRRHRPPGRDAQTQKHRTPKARARP